MSPVENSDQDSYDPRLIDQQREDVEAGKEKDIVAEDVEANQNIGKLRSSLKTRITRVLEKKVIVKTGVGPALMPITLAAERTANFGADMPSLQHIHDALSIFKDTNLTYMRRLMNSVYKGIVIVRSSDMNDQNDILSRLKSGFNPAQIQELKKLDKKWFFKNISKLQIAPKEKKALLQASRGIIGLVRAL